MSTATIQPDPRTLSLGPGIIGKEQYEANQRFLKVEHRELGPAAVMLGPEFKTWELAGKPQPWAPWLEKYRGLAKARAAKAAKGKPEPDPDEA